MNRIERLVKEHAPEEHHVIGDTVYLIIQQAGSRDFVEYGIKAIPKDSESYWLLIPESRFETLGGARLAILMDLAGVY